jgi:hypothetical protein
MGESAGNAGETLTEQQKKWFASVKDGLVRDTGKSIEEWAAIARACPETTTRKQIDWLRDNYGLGVNRGAIVLNAAFPDRMDWYDADGLKDALWKDAASRAIFEAVEARVAGFDGLVTGQRKGFSAWSRKAQFAAIKPTKGGGAVLGLAVPPDADARLQGATGKDGWSDRLKSRLALASAGEVDDGVGALLAKAFAAP